MQTALTPVATRFNPYAGREMIQVEHVLIGGEIALALQQTKTMDVRRLENLMPHCRRIIQWPPENFTVAHLHQQAVGVMDFSTIIIRLMFRVLAEPEHARQRREAHGVDRLMFGIHG